MGSVYAGIPPNIAIRLRDEYNLKVFVETGTFLGRSSAWAAKMFESVYTIESNFDFYARASAELAKYDNVLLFHGFSQSMLAIVLRMFSEPALIWLDAHWSKDLGYDKFAQVICPVLKEIKVIGHNRERHVVMIDDVRLFGKKDWPSRSTVERELQNIGLTVTVEDDVFVAVPKL